MVNLMQPSTTTRAPKLENEFSLDFNKELGSFDVSYLGERFYQFSAARSPEVILEAINMLNEWKKKYHAKVTCLGCKKQFNLSDVYVYCECGGTCV